MTHAAGNGQAERERSGGHPGGRAQGVGLRPGDEIIMRVEDGELRLSTRRQALARARRMIRQYIPEDADLTQSLIEDRRREADRP